MAQTVESHANGPGTVVFELERLEQVDRRLALSGRWFGVRGRRFVRPTLIFALDGRSHRLLADLEHKPWPAEDGHLWLAAFPWEGGTDGLREIELTVAPDISIELAGSGTRVRRPARTGRLPDAHARAEAMRQESETLRRELASEREANEQLRRELGPLREQLVAQREEAQSLSDELEQLRAEKVQREAVLGRRETSLAKLKGVKGERDRARRALERADAERDELRRTHRQTQIDHERSRAAVERLQTDLDAARHAHDRVAADRDQALRVRDQALAERDRAVAERDELRRVGENVQSQRAAARALVHRRSLSWRGTSWITPASSSARSQSDVLRREVGWGARAAALTVLIVAVLVLLVLLHAL